RGSDGVTTLTLSMVLLAAVLHASWNALVKGSGDQLTRMAFIHAVASLCALPLVLVLPPPDAASWPYTLTSAAVHQAYYACLLLGHRVGVLSQVYPLARGVAPLLVAVGAFVFAGEALSAQGLVAVVLISVAIVSLALTGGADRRSVAATW